MNQRMFHKEIPSLALEISRAFLAAAGAANTSPTPFPQHQPLYSWSEAPGLLINTSYYTLRQYRAGNQLWRCHNNVESPRSLGWSSVCHNNTLRALGRVLFTSTQSITILLLIRNSLCLLFSQVEQNDIKSLFSSRGSPNGWTDAWGTIKERRNSFISLHI